VRKTATITPRSIIRDKQVIRLVRNSWGVTVTPIPTIAPRCLNQFRVRPVSSRDAGLPVPEGFATWALGCPCGDDRWRVLGNWFAFPLEFEGPLHAECSKCGCRLRLINTATDGYNGEIGVGIVEAETAREMWTCPDCGTPEGSLLASFGYQYEPDGENTDRLQDFFDAFLLTHLCLESRQPVRVAMFDCA
jgi:hypothetical protein